MTKKVLIAGLLGGVVLLVWSFLVNGVLGFNSRTTMKTIPEERRVYEILAQEVVEPGAYVCNPEPGNEGFPPDEPVFSIRFSGVGHGAAGKLMLFQLPLFFMAPLILAWLLSMSSQRVLSSYGLKVLFFALIGLFVAVFSDLEGFGIGGYPLSTALALAANHVAQMTAVGLVVGWKLQPQAG